MTTFTKFLNKKRILVIIFFLFISTSLINFPLAKFNKPNQSLVTKEFVEKEAVIEAIFLPIPKKHSATWYSLPGNTTYSGEKFYKDSLTAAYNFRGMGTILKVTNLNNNKSVIVKVNDKMGNKSKNIIDLSHGAFKKIASPGRGKIEVKVEELKKES